MKEANMRTIVIFVTVIVLIVAAGLADSEADDKPTLYTAYNMWKSSKMKCINFKEGDEKYAVFESFNKPLSLQL
jgi:hypothetical protein